MGWFSKAIPERKWPDTSITLFAKLKDSRDSWYSTFLRGTASQGIAFKSIGITPAAAHYISLLQLSAVAATLQDNGYVSDATFFLELVYIPLTGNLPAELHHDIEANPFARASDAKLSLELWAKSMANQLPSDRDNPRLLEELKRYGSLIVIQAKIATCEACNDTKGAQKIRNVFAE